VTVVILVSMSNPYQLILRGINFGKWNCSLFAICTAIDIPSLTAGGDARAARIRMVFFGGHPAEY